MWEINVKFSLTLTEVPLISMLIYSAPGKDDLIVMVENFGQLLFTHFAQVGSVNDGGLGLLRVNL